MLAKKYRLPVHKIYKIRGRTFNSDYFSIKIVGNDLGFNRFGVVVGAKVSKKAVVRNKLRRLIFSAISGNFKNISNIGKDLLIIVKPTVIYLSKEEIKNQIIKLLTFHFKL
jgi:ribonuclease P protein component